MKYFCHKFALILLILALSTPFAIFNGVIINYSAISCLDSVSIYSFDGSVIGMCQNNLECLQKLCVDNVEGIFIEKAALSNNKHYDFAVIPHEYYHVITFMIICMFFIVIFNLGMLIKIYDKSVTYKKTISVCTLLICLFITIATIFYCINIHTQTVNNLSCLNNLSITGYGYTENGSLNPITETRYCSDIGCFTGNTSVICKDNRNSSITGLNITYGHYPSKHQIDLIPIYRFSIYLFFFLCIIICVPLCFALFICDFDKVITEYNRDNYIHI